VGLITRLTSFLQGLYFLLEVRFTPNDLVLLGQKILLSLPERALKVKSQVVRRAESLFVLRNGVLRKAVSTKLQS
jgi:hypothetical protein